MKQNKVTVLVIEDEKGICNFISSSLQNLNYHVEVAHNGTDAKNLFLSQCPELVLLDLGLPDMDGMELIKIFREWADTSIIIVSARDREKEKVQALDLGADDYITKPFGISELMARVRTALRHKSRTAMVTTEESEILSVKDLTIDMGKHLVMKGNQEIHFTVNEFKCLSLLAKHAGKVLTYDFIIKHIWGAYGKMDNQTLRVNMTNIRRKLGENPAEPKYILTELGIGYRMLEED